MFKKHVHLNFDDDKDTYISGEQISGTVILDLDEPTKVSEIYLKIKGSGSVSWEIELKGRERTTGGGSRRKTRPISAGKDFVDSSIAIWKPGVPLGEQETDDPNKIPAGEHKFTWSFQLSKSLPSSHKNLLGHIKYYVKVKVDRPWAVDWEDEKKFTVIEFCDLQDHPRTRDEIVKRDRIYAGYACFFRKPIDVVVKLPSGGMIAQQTFPIQVEITNKSQRNISYSALKLKQMCKMSIGRHKQERHTIVFEHKQGTIAAGETSTWDDVSLTLPSLASSGGSWHHLQIEYEFKFIVKTSWVGPRMKLKWPVIIGTHFHSGNVPSSRSYGANADQYPGPTPYEGPAPSQYTGSFPVQYTNPGPIPYPGPTPSPYPGANPTPYQGPAPAPYPASGSIPYPGANTFSQPGAFVTSYPNPSSPGFPGGTPSSYTGHPPSPYSGAPPAPYAVAPPAPCPGAPIPSYPNTQTTPYPGAPLPTQYADTSTSSYPGSFPPPGSQPAPYPSVSSPYPPSSQGAPAELFSCVKPEVTSDSGDHQVSYPGSTNIEGNGTSEASAPPPGAL